MKPGLVPVIHATHNGTNVGRRQLLHQISTGLLVLCPTAQAAENSGDLPKDYVRLTRQLIKGLREPVELEQMGASELEVRKKADNAREPVRQFINNWKDKQSVRNTIAYRETAAALEELGQYYIRKGQRAALDKATADSILRHLDAAEAQLPVESEKKGVLSGLFG